MGLELEKLSIGGAGAHLEVVEVGGHWVFEFVAVKAEFVVEGVFVSGFRGGTGVLDDSRQRTNRSLLCRK